MFWGGGIKTEFDIEQSFNMDKLIAVCAAGVERRGVPISYTYSIFESMRLSKSSMLEIVCESLNIEKKKTKNLPSVSPLKHV